MVFGFTLLDNIFSMHSKNQQVGSERMEADRYIYVFICRYVSMKSGKYAEKIDGQAGTNT